MVYRPTIPPAGLDADGLRRWTEDEFRGMAQGLSNFDLLQFNKIVAPAGPVQGMLAYADGTTWNPGGGEGVYERVASGWRQLWQTERPEVNYNYVPCNAGFDLWQRGVSIAVAASTAAWWADRWGLVTGPNQAHTVSRQVGMGSTQYCGRIQRNAGQTGTGTIWIEFPLDTDEVISLRGKKLSISMLLRGGANFSPASGIVQPQVITGTGTPGRIATSAYPGRVDVISVNAFLPSVATRFQYDASVAVPTNATQITILFSWAPVGTAGAADYFEIGEVTLTDITNGTFVAPFVSVPLALDLTVAQRTFETNMPTISTTPAQNVSNGMFTPAAISATQSFGSVPFMVKKRVSPTMVYYAPNNALTGIVGTAGRWQSLIAGAWTDASIATSTHVGTLSHFTPLTTVAAGFAAGGAYLTAGGWTADASLP